MKNILKDLRRKDHKRYLGGLDLFRYIGPGLLVTVGFIDPGNWASNFAAGSEFGYALLWVVTLSTVMLIILQHNVAHLGIATGLCLSEAATKYTSAWVSRPILGTAVLASISTSLAEILGGAIALEMLFGVPIGWGAILTTAFVVVMLFTNSYRRIERAIIGFVSVIGLSFVYEFFLVEVDWPAVTRAWVTPSLPEGSLLVVMSVLGAVVMPHNLFLHSEVVQSREFNKRDDASIRRALKYELFDTLFSMFVGWAINSAMILLAAAALFQNHIEVTDLSQANSLLEPLLGNNAAVVFALALLLALDFFVWRILRHRLASKGCKSRFFWTLVYFLPLALTGAFCLALVASPIQDWPAFLRTYWMGTLLVLLATHVCYGFVWSLSTLVLHVRERRKRGHGNVPATGPVGDTGSTIGNGAVERENIPHQTAGYAAFFLFLLLFYAMVISTFNLRVDRTGYCSLQTCISGVSLRPGRSGAWSSRLCRQGPT